MSTTSLPAAGEPLGVEIDALTHRFGDVVALDAATATIRPGTITGLIGRNGAGKTTLAALIASLRKVQSGTLLVGGQEPWENPAITSRVCLMKDTGSMAMDSKTREALRDAEMLRPNFDRDYCLQLLDMFQVRVKGKPEQLSRGKQSALRASIALATRAELTIVDEVYLGMDAVARRMFYDAMMADYVAHPRTIVISSHILDEVEDLMEDVIVIDRGRVAAHAETDTVRARYTQGDHLASLTDVLVAVSGATQEGVAR